MIQGREATKILVVGAVILLCIEPAVADPNSTSWFKLPEIDFAELPGDAAG